ncbi:MAG: ribonuclease HI family protein [Thermoleophilaceae bacterium]
MHVDGGARGNPGPAAAGAVVSAPDGTVLREAGRFLGRTTNNVAEYRAVLLGLELAAELGGREVELDERLRAGGATDRGSATGSRTPAFSPLYEEAMATLRGFDRWSVRNVPRAGNARADALVNQALDEAVRRA